MNSKFHNLATIGIKITETEVSVAKKGKKPAIFALNELTKISIIKTGVIDFSGWAFLRILSKFSFFHPQSENAAPIYQITVQIKHKIAIRIDAKNFYLIGVNKEIKRINAFLEGYQNLTQPENNHSK